MRTLVGICTGALIAALGGPAAADGVSNSKALIEKYSKLPTFEAPGPAFDAKACMKDKKIFAIPLTDDNPFEVAILAACSRRPRWSASTSGPGRPSSRPTNGLKGSTRPSRSTIVSLISSAACRRNISRHKSPRPVQGRQSRDDP